MWRKYGLNIAALIIMMIVRMIIVPAVLPKEYGAYPRIMSYQIRRDYPMYDLVNLRNLESASVRSGYSMETLIAIDLLMKNQMDPLKAQNSIEEEFEEIPMPETFKMELLPDKISEVHQTYDRPVRLIAILFEITMVIILATILYYVLFYFDHKRRIQQEKRFNERIV
ncbi:hypothetical protein ACHAL6_08315 [Proteiniclasticum sp. C24MP]|uniref:hypothetical protein n=1 Tax=Proteiniclasticum sp. C24MP TaxID=3374101 RepID=UPI003754D087